MKQEDLNQELSTIFKELVTHTKERDEKINQGMEKLTDSVTQSNIEISKLAKIVAISEERHLSQQEFTRQQTIYNANNDDRVMDIEKQNIALKIQGDAVKERIKGFNKFAMGIISTILGAAFVGWLVVKPAPPVYPAIPSTQDATKIGN